MVEFWSLMAVGMMAAAIIFLPISWLLGRLLTVEPPTVNEWRQVFGLDSSPVVARKFATAFTTAVSAAAPLPIAATTAEFAVLNSSKIQVINPQTPTVTSTAGVTRVL